MKKIIKASVVMVLMVSVMPVSSCRTYKDGNIAQERVSIQETQSFEEYNISSMDQVALEAIAAHYHRFGAGEMQLTVTYDPASRHQGALRATDEAAKISSALRKLDVPASVGIMPVKDAHEMTLLVSYGQMEAIAPDCGGVLPGLEDRTHSIDLDYQMGCSVETMIARQISRPKDLLGRKIPVSTTDARGISNQIDITRAGALNEPLGGESASQ